MDSAKDGIILTLLFPQCMPPFMALLQLYGYVDQVPFGSLLLFVGMQWLAGNKDLPVLLRFNLQQAVHLDILRLIPSLITFGASFVPDEDAGAIVRIVGSMLCYL